MKNRSPKNSKSLKKDLENSTQKSPEAVAVIGSGAWGLGISRLIARNGHLVHVFSRDIFEAAAVNKKFIKDNLPAVASTDLKSVTKDVNSVFIVVPSDAVLLILKSLASIKISSKANIIICSKGLDSKNLQLFSDCVANVLPNNPCIILSGPNFADEVGEALPTITTLASTNKKSALAVAALLKDDNFLPVISDDLITTQIFGAIKNIFAIGCGIIDGLDLGENAKATLVVKGVLEANELIEKLGGNAKEHFISAAGLGDLFLTCSSEKSRNNSLGAMIGSGKKVKEIIKSGTTFEGFKAAESMIKFSKKHKIKLPLCETIHEILQGNFTTKEIKKIISKAILDY